MSRYDHAAALQRSATPAVKLAYLVGELRAWAVLNPTLQPLYREFERLLRDDFGSAPTSSRLQASPPPADAEPTP